MNTNVFLFYSVHLAKNDHNPYVFFNDPQMGYKPKSEKQWAKWEFCCFMCLSNILRQELYSLQYKGFPDTSK